jgi:hypothetical protein
MARWIWCSWITRGQSDVRQLYGFSAETLSPAGTVSLEKTDLPSGAILEIDQIVLADDDPRKDLELSGAASPAIDLSQVFRHRPVIGVELSRSVYLDAFGQQNIRSTSFYGLPNIKQLLGSCRRGGCLLDSAARSATVAKIGWSSGNCYQADTEESYGKAFRSHSFVSICARAMRSARNSGEASCNSSNTT